MQIKSNTDKDSALASMGKSVKHRIPLGVYLDVNSVVAQIVDFSYDVIIYCPSQDTWKTFELQVCACLLKQHDMHLPESSSTVNATKADS